MEIEEIREKAIKAICPLRSADTDYFGARRTAAGFQLPDYYLVYFLLVDLIGFKDLGRYEKVAWSVPVDFEGRLLHIEHRKMGLGVFASYDDCDVEAIASEVVKLIRKGIEVAQPYYDWRAKKAIDNSQINVRNKSYELYGRFKFFLDMYESKCTEIERMEGDYVILPDEDGSPGRIKNIGYEFRRDAEWLALSAIESFFSWTEHVFIHLAILRGKCLTGHSVNDLAGADWKKKFKAALNINQPALKSYYDKLLLIRTQVRNFAAHGAFGKDGEAFLFHSGAGAVPVKLPHRYGEHSYRFSNHLGDYRSVPDDEAIALIKDFIDYIRSGEQALAWIYLDSGMDLVLSMAQNGTYEKAMSSEKNMNEFVEDWLGMADLVTNMDF